MQDNIQPGSKELARERKLVREIILLLDPKGGKHYEYLRSDEVYGGHQSGYQVEYILIKIKPKGRIVQTFKLRFATCGADWECRNDPNRVVVTVWGKVCTMIEHPIKEWIERLIHGASHTFDRKRSRVIQARIVTRLIEQQQAEYDKMLARVEALIVDRDRFGQLFDRVKKDLNIPAAKVWRPHTRGSRIIELGIPRTKRRITHAKVEVGMDGQIDLIISELTEQKLQKIVQIIRS